MKSRTMFQRIALIFLFSILMAPVQAIQVKSLYSVEIPLQADEAEPVSQEVLFQQAFKDVLARVSGSDKVFTKVIIQEAIQNTDKYIKQFSYHEPTEGEQIIKVVFHENLVNSLLDSAKVEVIGKSRPSTLVWALIEQDNVSRFAGFESSDLNLISKMDNVFSYRAIPVFFPLMDIEDTNTVTEQDVETANISAINKASRRYHPEAVLVGRIIQKGEHWQAHWTFVSLKDTLVENTMQWENVAFSLDELIGASADDLSAKFVQEEDHAPQKLQESRQLALMVSGIVSAKQYNKVFSYLQGLKFIQEVEVLQITPEKTIFEIQANVGNSDLKKSFLKDQVLDEEFSPESSEKVLFFRVMG